MSSTLTQLSEGASLAGDNGNPSDSKPAWYDDDKFNRGRDFFSRHKAAITFSMHTSLVAGFSIINLLEPLVFTQQSNTGEKSFKRYLMTFYHIYKWMTGDIWDSKSDAYQSLEMVRAMHGSVARRMAKKHEEKVHVSQYDMGLVQSGFFGAVLMYPEEFGIRCTDGELDDYVFVWRVVGYKLGLSDHFNICKPNLSDTKALVKEIEQECVLKALLDPPKDFHVMAEAYISGTNAAGAIPLNSIDSLLSLIFDGLKMKYPKTLSIPDTLRYYFLKSLFFLVFHFPSFERFFNRSFMHSAFEKFISQADEMFQQQKKLLYSKTVM